MFLYNKEEQIVPNIRLEGSTPTRGNQLYMYIDTRTEAV